jgi:uncharacterized repeat protein (TIGR01451 family)
VGLRSRRNQSYRLAAGAAAAVALLLAPPAEAGVVGVPTSLNADGTVQAGSVNPPGWLVLTGPTAANSLGDTVHRLRLFVEVEDRGVPGTADETLDIRIFDPGASGARDAGGTAASTTRYQVFSPTAVALANLAIGDDTGVTENRLARLSSTGAFTAANAGTPFTGRAAGLYELRITVESGDETNALGVEITNGAGYHYNVYTVGSSNSPGTAFVAGTVTGTTAPFAATIAPIVFFPYVTQGCSISASNYDLDANVAAGAGATAAIQDALGATTALDASANQLHVENAVTIEPTTTLNPQSTNYGIWTLTNGPGTDDNRAIDWRIANFQGWNTNPLALPRDPAQPVRMYLPNGYSPSSGNPNATAPVEPYLATALAVVSGANPPQAGVTTRYLLTASVLNPAVAGSVTNLTVTIPFMTGDAFVSSSASPACTTEVAGATYRSCTFASLAAGAVASYSITVDDTPAAGFAGLRNLTGAPTTRSAQIAAGGLTYAAGLATANTTTAHGFQTGDYVTVSGAVQGEYNGLYRVTVVDADTFTYSPTTAPAVSPATGETILATVPGCPTTADGPVCATYTPIYNSTTYPHTERLGPVCPLSVFVAPTNVNLSVSKSAVPSPVTAGQDLTYTITATNPAGSGTALNVAVVDPLPANTTFRSIVVPSGWSCATPPVGTRGTVSCSRASMATSTTGVFTIVVNVDSTATGTVANTATVSSLGTDANPADNSATATVTIDAPAGQADLAITKVDRPDPVVAGSDITYTMTIRNNGPAPAAAPVFRDAIPTNTTFRAIALPSGWACTALPAVGGTGPITCSAPGPMASGSSVTILLSVRVSLGATGTITNSGQSATGATVSSTTTDNVPGNNAASAATTIAAAPAAPACGPTGSTTIPLGTWVDGGTLTGVVNTYYPATASAGATATSITLGPATGATTPISAGDLLLVIQMQDAQANWTNSSSYGDGVAGDPGSGYMAANETGLHEFVRASNNVGLGGATLNLTTGLVNSYTNAAYNPPPGTTQGQRRFQVVRVPQYRTATLGSSLTAGPWDGTSGGVLVFDVANVLDLGGATVDVSSKGFRGGGGRGLGGDGGPNDDDYRSLATDNCHAPKGEGIAGTPRYMWDEPRNLLVDTGVEGYPNGSQARGAPGNAGGGGSDGNCSANDQNTGGGGGGNGGAGGKGGNAWNSQEPYGGFGGAAYFSAANPVNPQTPTEVILGGGGGAGTRNNSSGIESSGGSGGGIIFVRAGSVTGTGTLVASGSNGHDAGRDGGGGGGGGGTIVVSTMSGGLSGLTVIARGGSGGDSWPTQAPNGNPGERHGPGGGGGGGVVWLSAAGSSIDVSGGIRGITTTANDPYGAVSGNPGLSGVVQPSQIPGLDSGAECSADVAILKTSSPQTPIGPQATYNLLVTNNGFRQATNVIVTDSLPTGTTYVSSATSQGGPCTYLAPVLTCNLGSLNSGASAVVTVVVNSAGGVAPTNTGTVTHDQYDPVAANNSSTVGALADLAVTLSGTPEPVPAGATLQYRSTVWNNGPNPATNAVLSFPIPPSTSFGSISPPAGWTCVTPALGGTGTIRCSRSSDMPIGVGEEFAIDVYVGAGTPPNTLIPATATISSANDTVPANNSATTENTVVPSVVLITRTRVLAVRFDPASGLVEYATGWQQKTRSFDLYATPGPVAPAEGQPSLNEAPVRAPRPDTLGPTLYRVAVAPFSGAYLWIVENETGGRRNRMGPYAAWDQRLSAAFSRLEKRALRAEARQVDLGRGARAWVLPAAAARRVTSGPAQLARRPVWRPPVREATEGLRIEVGGPGDVRLTRAELEAGGLPSGWPLSRLTLTLAGQDVPFGVVAPGFGTPAMLVFDATALRTVYSGPSPYILSWRGRPRMGVPLTREGDLPWPGWLRVERSWLYVPSVPLGTDPWVWDAVGFDGPSWPSIDPTAGDFELPALLPGPEDVPVRIRVLGYGPYRHEIEAAINGSPVGSVSIEGTQPALIEGYVARSVLRDAGSGGGANQLTLTYHSDAPEPGLAWAYLDHLDLLVAPDPEARPTAPHEVLAFDPDLKVPTGCDYLVVTHPRFEDQAQRLASLKRAAGHSVAVVDVERIYDHFSAGIVEAEAVRALIGQAAREGGVRYVLLFGDDTFDYRDDAETGAVSYVPSLYGWDGEFGRVPSETRYADVDGDGSPDVAIGRLPAQDEAEAALLVDKIERQEAVLAGSAGRHLFAVDRDDPTPGAPSFAGEARAVAARIGGGAVAWADAGVDPQGARQVLFSALEAGVAFTHVFSHGAPWQWGNAGLLTVDDVQGVDGGPPVLGEGPETIVLTWACLSQFYTYLWGETVNEALLLKPRGGAMAAFGPAGISDLAAQAALYERLYAELPRAGTIGDAIRNAKAAALAEDPRAAAVVEGWNLLGDPALRIDAALPRVE